MKGCKNCPAYAKCIVTYRGSACAALRGTYGADDDPGAWLAWLQQAYKEDT